MATASASVVCVAHGCALPMGFLSRSHTTRNDVGGHTQLRHSRQAHKADDANRESQKGIIGLALCRGREWVFLLGGDGTTASP
jgi:hypothetical protein